MDGPASKAETATMLLDRRDIQTLMYCVRLAEVHGEWQTGYPVRSPNQLECKLAQLLVELDGRQPRTAAAQTARVA